MKKFIIVITTLFYSFLGANMIFAADNTWTQKADFGWSPRWGAVGFSIGNKGYIGMGWDGMGWDGMFQINHLKTFGSTTKSPTLGHRKQISGGENGRSGAVGFSIGSKGYIGTGYEGNSYTKDFWEYDPAGDTWTQKADLGGGSTCGCRRLLHREQGLHRDRRYYVKNT